MGAQVSLCEAGSQASLSELPRPVESGEIQRQLLADGRSIGEVIHHGEHVRIRVPGN